ncbi:MAG: PD40 domain-containing protein [Steroidobacter sp.]|nr:PD40 domain-containing protein [Steroidobacter sp.]
MSLALAATLLMGAVAAASSPSLPLEPTRTVEFVTEEGTWMSLDVSPDGRTIVFDLLGDLYQLPIEGGEARALTSGMALDAQPRYSPDGRSIVFISDRGGNEGLWLIDADGTHPRAVVEGDAATVFTSPEWIPDGEAVVVTETSVWTRGRTTRPKLSVYRIADGSKIELDTQTQTGAIRPHGAAFGADAKNLYFSGYSQDSTSWTLYRHDRSTAQSYAVTNGTLSSVRPALSTDGRWLAYVTGDGIDRSVRLRDLSDASERWLLQQFDPELLPGYGAPNGDYDRDLMPGWAFTADSRALIASYRGKLWRVDVPSGKQTQIPFRVPVRLQLGPLVHQTNRIDDQAERFIREIRDPRTSPDGRQVVFSAASKLWTMDLPAGKPRRLTASASDQSRGEFEPVWSPDGRYVTYATWSDELGGALYRVRADGSGKSQQLTKVPGFYTAPAYTPDGRRIVFVQGSLDARRDSLALKGGDGEDHTVLAGLELRWIAASGGDSQVVAPVHTLVRPHFSQDGTRVYFYDRLAPKEKWLVSVNFAGADLRRHLRVTEVTALAGETPRGAADIRIAPDGHSALVLGARSVSRIEWPAAQATELQVHLPNVPAQVRVQQLNGLGAKSINWSDDGRTAVFNLGTTLYRVPIDAKERAASTHQTQVRIPLQRPRPDGSIVLRGARIITMASSGVIEAGDIVIERNRIVAVGPTGTIPLPVNAKVVDLSGTTIMPGLIDVHAHPNAPDRIAPGQYWEFQSYLAYGVTAIHDPGPGPGATDGSLDDWLSYADLLESGQMLGPRLYTTGPLVMWYDEIRTLDDARRVLRLRRDTFGAHTIKYYDAGNRTQRQLVAMAARELGLALTNEPSRRFKTAFNHIVDGYSGVEHDLGLTPLYDDVVQVLARSGTSINMTFNPVHIHAHEYPAQDAKLSSVTPQLQIQSNLEYWRVTAPKYPSEFGYERFSHGLARLVGAGGHVGFGGHSWAEGLGTHFELWAFASRASNEAALRAGTLGGAYAMGLEKELGSIEVGKLADLLVLERNPLDNIRNSTSLRYVIQDGVMRR